MALELIDGNEAVARAACAAGCRFFAGYPITPASSVLDAMLRLLPARGGVVLQAEDEIAAIGACLGAAMAGAMVLTATSGPGISLYSENISFAIGSEIPIVILDVQRLGPSTGSATRGADGDIQFLRWGNSGGLPVVVLAPTCVADSFTLTLHAFDLAERYRCPVFLASNKEIALTREGIDLEALPHPEIGRRPAPRTGEPFRPFAAPPGTDVPGFLPIGADVPVRQTSSTHGADGYITTDPTEIAAGIARLERKLLAARDAMAFTELDAEDGAETLVVCYGVTARAARQAVRAARSAGQRVSLLVLKTLWPVPETALRAALATTGRVLVVEMNTGLYLREVQRLAGNREVRFLGQMDGRLIAPEQIQESLRG